MKSHRNLIRVVPGLLLATVLALRPGIASADESLVDVDAIALAVAHANVNATTPLGTATVNFVGTSCLGASLDGPSDGGALIEDEVLGCSISGDGEITGNACGSGVWSGNIFINEGVSDTYAIRFDAVVAGGSGPVVGAVQGEATGVITGTITLVPNTVNLCADFTILLSLYTNA